MKRHLAIVFASLLAFAVGELAYDVTHPPIAEASGGSGSAGGTCGTGTGSAVCATSPTLTTPVLGVATGTSLTLTQGVSAVTGVFSGAVSTGALTAVGAASTAGGTFTGGAVSGNGAYGVIGNAGSISNSAGVRGVAINTSTSAGVQGVCAQAACMGMYATSSTAGQALVAEVTSATGAGAAFEIRVTDNSPTQAPIKIEPLNTDPAACGVGDLFLCDGSAGCGSAVKLRCCTATNTWGYCN